MKLKTLSSDFTIFRKNITRFCPVWALYSVLLLMVTLTFYSTSDTPGLWQGVVAFGSWMVPINLIYALVCALALFGDLFNGRMCNAIHALPLRRESWFGIHVLSGLCFSLIPNVLFALAMLPCSLGANWLWLVQSTAQFLLYFGTAVLCVQCAGSRFATVVVYGLLHFGALVIYWLLDTLYLPLLPGVVLDLSLFSWLCPTEYYLQEMPYEVFYDYPNTLQLLHNPTGWTYLAISAAAGLGFGALALILYRRRNLETAGDFIAIAALKPVFLVSYTLVMATCFHAVFQLFLGENEWLFMILGLLVGYFTGQMFLMRTTHVFGKKPLIGFGVLVLSLGLSLGITRLDPLNITGWVPRTGDVTAVLLSQNYHEVKLTDPDLIRQITAFHEEAAKDYEGLESGASVPVSLTYTLRSGRTVQREYWISINSPEGKLLRPVVSSPEFVLSYFYPGFDYTRNDFSILIDHEYHESIPRQLRQALMECLIRDCEEGNLPQHWWNWNETTNPVTLDIQCPIDGYRTQYLHLTVTEHAKHTVQWLKDHDFWYPEE